MAVEIGVERPERELGAIGILEAQLAVANDPGAVQNAAGPARGARAPRIKSSCCSERAGAWATVALCRTSTIQGTLGLVRSPLIPA